LTSSRTAFLTLLISDSPRTFYAASAAQVRRTLHMKFGVVQLASVSVTR
jgi:hypothetical protein